MRDPSVDRPDSATVRPPSTTPALRVLFVISQLDGTGGAGRSVAELAEGLTNSGVHAEVACFRRAPTGLEDALEHHGVPVHVLEADHLGTAVLRLRRLIRTRAPHILHTTLYAADQAGRLAAWRTPARVVSSIVNPTHDPATLVDDGCPLWRRRLLWALDGWTARHLTSRIHAITQATRTSAIEGFRVPPDHVTVVYRSRDTARLGSPSGERRQAVRRSLQLDNELIVFNAARQEGQKGQVFLVEAFARLAVTLPNAVVLIAGAPGSATDSIEGAITRHDLGDRVRLLGHRDDIGDLLAAADVFAFPSMYEGLGAALIEAMALGTPIVASDLPATREVTDDGQAAVLVPAADPEALAVALQRLLSDHELHAELSARGRAHYLASFTPEQIVTSITDLYNSVMTADQARQQGVCSKRRSRVEVKRRREAL